MTSKQELLKIIVEKPSQEKLKTLSITGWPIWTSDVKAFDWEYDSDETCYFLEGHVKVKTLFEEVEIKKGDLVTFPKGLKCTWQVIEPVKKVYNFR